MKVKGAAVFAVQLLVLCSAFPSRSHHHRDREVDDFVKKLLVDLRSFDPLTDMFGLSAIRLPKMPRFANFPLRLTVTKHFQDLLPKLGEQPNLRGGSLSEKKEIPLPVIPSFDVALARFGYSGHHLLGLLPETESIPDNMLKVDDIQVPETMQLVLVFPKSSALPKNFKALVVVLKDQPFPANGRALKFSFPHLRIPDGGFASPSNAELVATSTDSKQFISTPYLCLGLLPNVPMSMPFSPLPPFSMAIPLPIPPFIPNLLVPSSPLPLAESAESTLIRSLEQFIKDKKDDSLFFPPENFTLTLIGHESFLSSSNEYPIGIVPKFMPLSSRFIQLPTPQNLDSSQDLWTDFLVVADTKKDQQPPPFFQPIIFTPVEQHLTSNGVRLPLHLRKTNDLKEPLDGVLVRSLFEPMPSENFWLYCITPKIKSNGTLTDNKKSSSDTDVLDYPAMQPRNKLVSTSSTTQSPVTYTSKSTTSKPTTKKPTTTVPSTAKPTPKPVEHEARINKFKPLPSKKSWKNRLPTKIEPSVTVVKRAHQEPTEFSILSFFGF